MEMEQFGPCRHAGAGELVWRKSCWPVVKVLGSQTELCKEGRLWKLLKIFRKKKETAGIFSHNAGTSMVPIRDWRLHVRRF